MPKKAGIAPGAGPAESWASSPGVEVEVLGCFWHRCPKHGTPPRANAECWKAKLEGNVARDKRTAAQLRRAGWTLVRVWEHENPSKAADRVQRVLGR